MTAYPLSHNIGQGARIYTPKEKIDIIVRGIRLGRDIEGFLDVFHEDESYSQFSFRSSHGFVKVVDDIKICLSEKSTPRQARISYQFPNITEYFIDHIEEREGRRKLRFPEKSKYLKKKY